MCGNVWEWVDDPIAEGASAWVMGGSFASQLRPLAGEDEARRVAFEHLDVDESTRGEDIGLRCVADAAEWLSAHAQSFSAGDDTHVRLVAGGRRFGGAAVPMLEEVRAAGHGSQAIAWLLEGAQQ
jgi:hypothetical protein